MFPILGKRRYLQELANEGDRKVSAYDERVRYRSAGIPFAEVYYSAGNLWVARPGGHLTVEAWGKWQLRIIEEWGKTRFTVKRGCKK